MPPATDRSPANDTLPVAMGGVYARSDGAVTRKIAGETVIVPVRDDVADLDSIYTLNETGSFVWELIDGQRTVDALIEAVAAEFEVSREVATADVKRLVATLHLEGLLRLAHG
jgi:hypothetical protein